MCVDVFGETYVNEQISVVLHFLNKNLHLERTSVSTLVD